MVFNANGFNIKQFNLNSAGGFSIAFWREDWSGQPTNLSKYQIGAAVSYGIPWSEQLGIGSTIRYFRASNQPFMRSVGQLYPTIHL